MLSFKLIVFTMCFILRLNVVFGQAETYQPQGLDPQHPPLTVLSMRQAESLYQYYKSRRELVFEANHDGCNQRAYLIGRDLESRGITSARAWLRPVAGTDRLKNPGRLERPEVNGWAYHTASIVAVRTFPWGPLLYVIDPSVPPGFQTLSSWKDKLVEHRPDMHTQLTLHGYRDINGPTPLRDDQINYYELARSRGVSRDEIDYDHATRTLADYRRIIDSGREVRDQCHSCYQMQPSRIDHILRNRQAVQNPNANSQPRRGARR